jgi:DNA-binding transcriptional LysR family regulator
MKDPRFAEHLSVFIDVVRASSFSGAGRRRGMSPSAIQRQIDTLETSLGVSLFTRSTRSLSLTDAGRALYEKAQRLINDMIDVHAEISSFGVRVAGVLRVASMPTFGKRFVVPTICELSQIYPDFRCELDLTEKIADPVVDRFDAVIRLGDISSTSLISTKLGTQTKHLVASPDYIKQYGVPTGKLSLANHRFIDKLYGDDPLGWSDVIGRSIGSGSDETVVLRSADFEALRIAALSGAGIALLANWVVAADIRERRLIRVDIGEEFWNHPGETMHLLRAVAQQSPIFQVFAKALRKSIRASRDWEPIVQTLDPTAHCAA